MSVSVFFIPEIFCLWLLFHFVGSQAGEGYGPTEMPITSAADQQTWIDEHNTARASLGATNMECISSLSQVKGFDCQFSWWAGGLRSCYRSTSDLRGPLTRSASPPLNWRSKPLTCSIVDLNLRNDLEIQWNSDLETLAQIEANKCISRNPTAVDKYGSGTCFARAGVATYVVDNTTVPTANAAVTYWLNEGATYYTLATDTCTAVATLAAQPRCDNYKQAFFSGVSEMGCAITYCNIILDTSSFSDTCPGCYALGSGYVAACAYDNPYSYPAYTVGAACGTCPSYKNTCTSSLCCGTATQCSLSTTLYRRWSETARDHFYTTTAYEADQALSQNFKDEGTVGTVWNSPTSANCSTLVPMFRMYHSGIQDHFYTTVNSQTITAERLGYRYERIEFYCVPSSTNTCGATLPLYRFWNPNGWDHFYTTTSGNYNGYSYESIECYIAP